MKVVSSGCFRSRTSLSISTDANYNPSGYKGLAVNQWSWTGVGAKTFGLGCKFSIRAGFLSTLAGQDLREFKTSWKCQDPQSGRRHRDVRG